MRRRAVGIIGGTGWIGRSIARALLSADLVDPGSLMLSGRSVTNADVATWPDVVYTIDNEFLTQRSDIVILSVRPEQFPTVAIDAQRPLVISVMAGVSVRTIGIHTNAKRIVRAMPNAAAELGKSYTPWFAAAGVEPSDKEWVQAAFEACGTADEVFNETDIDYLTGLTGSGPAFIALLADAMLSHAITHGLSHEFSVRAVRRLIGGCGPLVAEGDMLPAQIVDTFLSYKGTTAAGLQTMIAQGFVGAVHAGLVAAEATAIKRARLGSRCPT